MITQIDDLRKQSGVYCIIHRDSGMCYIGSSVDMERRRGNHLWEVTRQKYKSILYRALREFGPKSFDFEALEFCRKEDLLNREKFWIQFMGSATIDGLNTQKDPNATYIKNVSLLTRQRISISNTGKKRSQEHRAKISLAQLGKKRSPECIEKMRESKRLKPMCEKSRKSISDATRGRVVSNETRRKISESLTGKKLSPESIEKRNFSRINYTHSNETKQKISEKHKGKIFSVETREKMREAKLGKPGRKRSPESIAKAKRTRELKRQTQIKSQ